jgi:hypothetical protein
MTKSVATYEPLLSCLRARALELTTLRAAVNIQFDRIAAMQAELDLPATACSRSSSGTPSRLHVEGKGGDSSTPRTDYRFVLLGLANLARCVHHYVRSGVFALCASEHRNPALVLKRTDRLRPFRQTERVLGTTMTGTDEGRCIMTNGRTLTACAIGVLCLTCGLDGQGLTRYRDFELGGDIASVSALTGVASSEAKTIHQRPAVLQDLEWRPSRWDPRSAAASTDPVEQIHFSFYNDQLFRVAIAYAHERTEGMTSPDMIEAISAVYGTPLLGTPRAPARGASRIEIESGSPVAQWGDADHAVVLYQTSSYGDPFRLIVTDLRLDGLARKAETQAQRLDEQEAPSREIARQKKAHDDGRAAAEKARVVNKGVFRP